MPISCSDTTQLSQSFFFDIEGYVVAGGLGARNLSTGTGSFSIADPNVQGISLPLVGPLQRPVKMNVHQAFLYWNIIEKEDGGGRGATIMFGVGDTATDSVPGELIACCGNTCWKPFAPGYGPDPDPGDELINNVYRADVTSILEPDMGNPTDHEYFTFFDTEYTVDGLPYPGLAGNGPPAGQGPDETDAPGMGAAQGVVLVIVFEWVDGFEPSDAGFPREKDFWKIRIFDGAKLIAPTANPGQIIHAASCLGCPTFIFGVGDAQEAWSDMVNINGVPADQLAQNPQSTPRVPNATLLPLSQIFWGNVGAGLGLHQQVSPLQTNTVTIDMIPGIDCLCWFLYVFASHCCNCHAKIQLVSDGAGLNVNNDHKTVSLGDQTVFYSITQDNCDCLDHNYPVLISINGEDFEVMPPEGVDVELNDIIDIQLNSSNCNICEAYAPHCVTSSSGAPRTPTFITHDSSGAVTTDAPVTNPQGNPCDIAAPDCCGNTCLPPLVRVVFSAPTGFCTVCINQKSMYLEWNNNDKQYEGSIAGGWVASDCISFGDACSAVVANLACNPAAGSGWTFNFYFISNEGACNQAINVPVTIPDCSTMAGTVMFTPSATGNCACGCAGPITATFSGDGN